MCTNPITITRNYPSIGTRTYIVPCGKCAECTKKRQAEFSALALHQGLVSGSLYMFTLTYNNDSIPVAISDSSLSSETGSLKVIGFERGCSDWLDSVGFMNGLKAGVSPFLTRCCSLHREDLKLVLKHFRAIAHNKGWDLSNFKYAFFGEYGEERGRPHYHGLVFGLNGEQAETLKLLWVNRFGFAHVGPVPGKQVSIDDIIALSLYASKYISKGVYTRWLHILPFVEHPRRQSSLNFGSFSKEELQQLASFMMGEMSALNPGDDYLMMVSWIWFLLDAHVCKLLVNHSQSL